MLGYSPDHTHELWMTDFCIWGGPQPGSIIGNVEAVVVAYCSKPGHGTRVFPPGTLTAVYVCPHWPFYFF